MSTITVSGPAVARALQNVTDATESYAHAAAAVTRASTQISIRLVNGKRPESISNQVLVNLATAHTAYEAALTAAHLVLFYSDEVERKDELINAAADASGKVWFEYN